MLPAFLPPRFARENERLAALNETLASRRAFVNNDYKSAPPLVAAPPGCVSVRAPMCLALRCLSAGRWSTRNGAAGIKHAPELTLCSPHWSGTPEKDDVWSLCCTCEGKHADGRVS